MPSREAIRAYEERLMSYESTARRRPPARVTRRRPPQRISPLVRLRRIVLFASLLLVIYALGSFAVAVSRPSNVGFGVNAVEWLRGNGLAWLVNDIENVYYSLNAPKKGGPPLKRLPKVGHTGPRTVAASFAPAPIRPAIRPALRDEGKWHGTGLTVGGGAPVLVTTFRPDPVYPQMVAGVAWIDHSRTRTALYPGRYEPPSGPANRLAEVPPQLRSKLVATFNSGFKLEDAGGAGFFAAGHLYAPLKDGQATIIGYSNGTVDVRRWTGGPAPGPGVEFARQNLPLIVENGRLNPALSDGSLWGATLGNAVRVWRSGVGVDAHGNLIYASADIQTAQSLAEILQRAGAVRAMELDINFEWTTFNFYGKWGAGQPTKLLPGMDRPAVRYLTPDDRDFFAVYAR
jgi:phosphodiester glycosidase